MKSKLPCVHRPSEWRAISIYRYAIRKTADISGGEVISRRRTFAAPQAVVDDLDHRLGLGEVSSTVTC